MILIFLADYFIIFIYLLFVKSDVPIVLQVLRKTFPPPCSFVVYAIHLRSRAAFLQMREHSF